MGETIGACDAAKVLGVSRRTVLRMVKASELKPVSMTPGGQHRFSRTTLERMRDGLSPETAQAA